MTIFIILYIFQDQAKKAVPSHTTGQQNVFFCLMSSATGPISYATNIKLPASILLGLAPSFVMALMIISINARIEKEEIQYIFTYKIKPSGPVRLLD